jgi:hypothetical protein
VTSCPGKQKFSTVTGGRQTPDNGLEGGVSERKMGVHMRMRSSPSGGSLL